MKIYIKNLITILFLITTSLSAEVRFDLRFVDEPGIGFNAEGHEWMKKAVTEAADCLGKTIKQHAFVTIEVYADNNPEVYANAPQYLKEIESDKARYISKAMNKILNNEFPTFLEKLGQLWETGTDLLRGRQRFSGLWEGAIVFNTDSFNDFNTLKRITIHELTHTLGFASLSPDMYYNKWSSQPNYFDQLIVDKDGDLLFTPGSLDKFNPKFDYCCSLFACGPNIKKRNNEQCVKLYNPTTYKSGSSFSHLDDDTYPKNLLNHVGGKYNIWNKYEIGIMEDLGYEIDWEYYCKLVENEIPKPKLYTLIVDRDALQDANYYFILERLNDFPQECSSNKDVSASVDREIFNGSFSIQFKEGDRLSLLYSSNPLEEQLIYKCSSIKDFDDFENINILENNCIQFDVTSDTENTLKLTFIPKPVLNEVPKSYNLTIDRTALQLKNYYFKLESLYDSSQECSNKKRVFYKRVYMGKYFSTQFAEGDRLSLLYSSDPLSEGELIYKFSSIKDFENFKNINILDKNYSIHFDPTSDTDTLKLTFSSKESLEKCTEL